MIEVYTGKDITRDKIKIIKSISKKRYPMAIYQEYFKAISTYKDLAHLHATDSNIEKLVLGTDWFLCFSELESDVEISEWVSLDNDRKLLQVSEMTSFFKELFIRNHGKLFLADMRHDSSYRFLELLVKRGLIFLCRNRCILDCAIPEDFKNIIDRLKKKYTSLEKFLDSEESKDYEDYLKYILHSVSFIITDEFMKKYLVANNQKAGSLVKHP